MVHMAIAWWIKKGLANPGFRPNELNPMWKGNLVGHESIHSWVKRRKTKPRLCENCYQKTPYDLANISQKYKRDLSDWRWICRTCHMIEDGRLEKLHSPEHYIRLSNLLTGRKGKSGWHHSSRVKLSISKAKKEYWKQWRENHNANVV